MPTIFESINTELKENKLADTIAEQTRKVEETIPALKNFIAKPPSSINDMMKGLDGVSLPDIELTQINQLLGGISETIPEDLSNVTGPLFETLETLQNDSSGKIVPQLKGFMDSINAFRQLGGLDLTNSKSGKTTATGNLTGGSGGGGGGAASPPGSPAPGTPGSIQHQRRIQGLNNIKQGLNFFPSPFNASALILFMKDQLGALPRDIVHLRYLPIIDELTYFLATVVDLSEKDTNGLIDHLNGTLDGLTRFLNDFARQPLVSLTSGLSTLSAQLNATELKSETQQLSVHLNNIALAVKGGGLNPAAADIAALTNILDTFLPRLDTLVNNLFKGQVSGITSEFQRLPLDMEQRMRQVTQTVNPSSQLKLMEGVSQALEHTLATVNINSFSSELSDFFERVTSLLDILDVSVINEPLQTALTALQATVENFDQMLSQVSSQVSSLFDRLDDVLAAFDVSAVTGPVREAFEQFTNTLQTQAATLFEPVQTAISQGVAEINGLVSTFDPQLIIQPLEEVVNKLAVVLNSPEITGALKTIREAIETVSDTLASLSFEPITARTAALIEDMTITLRKIDPDELNAVLKTALKAAVGGLPKELTPITDPLLAEMDDLVEKGPKPVLQFAGAQPQKLLAQVKNYSPQKLIGAEISTPFNMLIEELEKFKPSDLLVPVEERLEVFKTQLKERVNPGLMLAPLEELFEQLLKQFEKFKPAELIKPLEEAISGLIDNLLKVLPVEEFFQAFDQILAGINEAVELTNSINELFEKTTRMITEFSGPEEQLRAWLNPLLGRIDEISDISALRPSFDNLSAAVNGLNAASLKTALEQTLSPIKTSLDELDPQLLLTDLTSAYRGISRDTVESLPDSAQKNELIAALDRFTPLHNAAKVFNGLQAWRENIVRDESAYHENLTRWDVRFHGAGGLFSGFSQPIETLPDVKTFFRETIENEVIAPLNHMLQTVDNTFEALSAPLQELKQFTEKIDAKAAELSKGPVLLTDIRNSLNDLIQRVRDLDLQFIVRELDDVFNSLKDKLTAVSPTAIRKIVEAAFNDAIDILDISGLLPGEALNEVDAAYQKIIDDLKQLDPGKVVVEAVQPVFDQTVIPLLDAFDISELIADLIERMENLDQELGREIETLNVSYRGMLSAVPA